MTRHLALPRIDLEPAQPPATLEEIRRSLAAEGLPSRDRYDLPESRGRFPDGAHYRVEIPSVEGPLALGAVLDEAARRGVPVHRVSQGSGTFMLTDAELDEMAAQGARAGVEVCLFARPNAGWDTSAQARAASGAAIAPLVRGQDQLVHALADIRRAADHGVRSVLIADFGLLAAFSTLRARGDLPGDMQAKLSVVAALANPSTARIAQDLGADTLNVPGDLTLPQIAAIRQAVDVPLDLYLESPDDLGGFVRTFEIAEVVRIAAPVHVKFGVRNSPGLYPAGLHLESLVVALSRERVRRAEMALALLRREWPDVVTSPVGGVATGDRGAEQEGALA